MGNRGFRKIDNELFEALLQADITRAGYKVLLTVIHFTIGYHKETAGVSLSTFQKMTGLARTSVIHAIRELERQQTLTVNKDGNSSIYRLRDIREWTSSVYATSERVKTLPVDPQNATKTGSVYATNTGSVPVPATPPYKDIRYKITSKERGTFLEDDDPLSKEGTSSKSGTSPSIEGLRGTVSLIEGTNYGDVIKAYLLTHGSSSMPVIAEALELPQKTVTTTLLNDPRFRKVGRFNFDLKDNTPITAEGSLALESQEDTLESHPSTPSKVEPLKPNIISTLKEHLAKQNIDAEVENNYEQLSDTT